MDVLVEAFLPGVHKIFSRHGITAEYYSLPWFLTLFFSDLDCEVVWCVWDHFLSSGWPIIFQVGLALLEMAEPDLAVLEFDDICLYLKTYLNSYESVIIIFIHKF